MIERIWHGWTEPADADEYERRLRDEIAQEFADRDIDGYHGIRLLRRDGEAEVEFVTIMRFESLEDVRAFAGDDYREAHVPQEAREVLSRYDDRVKHFEVRAEVEG